MYSDNPPHTPAILLSLDFLKRFIQRLNLTLHSKNHRQIGSHLPDAFRIIDKKVTIERYQKAAAITRIIHNGQVKFRSFLLLPAIRISASLS
jgi:hypothetical protein